MSTLRERWINVLVVVAAVAAIGWAGRVIVTHYFVTRQGATIKQQQRPQPEISLEATGCVNIDPRPGLWPRAPFTPRFHPNATRSLSCMPVGLDAGALQLNAESGCWEILLLSGPDPCYVWTRFDPTSSNHMHLANAFSRYGKYHSFGPADGDDGQTIFSYHFEVYGERLIPGSMQQFDYWYHPTMTRDLKRAWLERFGTPPVDPVQPPPSPPSPPPTNPPPSPPPVAASTCPTAATIAAQVWADRPIVTPTLGDRITSLADQIAALRLSCPEVPVSALVEEIARLRGEVDGLRQGLKPCPSAPPVDPPAPSPGQSVWGVAGEVHRTGPGLPTRGELRPSIVGPVRKIRVSMTFVPGSMRSERLQIFWLADRIHAGHTFVEANVLDGKALIAAGNWGRERLMGTWGQGKDKRCVLTPGQSYPVSWEWDTSTDRASLSVGTCRLTHELPAAGVVLTDLLLRLGHLVDKPPEHPWGAGAAWSDVELVVTR